VSTETTNAAIAAGLRELADWLEQHDELPADAYPDFSHPVMGDDDGDRTAVVEAYAKALGVAPVEMGGHLTARRSFGPIEYKVYSVSQQARDEHQAENSYIRNIRAGVAEAQTAGAR
jgi:hypothetical protein